MAHHLFQASGEPIDVPVKNVVADTALQVRTKGLDPDHIRVLEETPEAWPPVTVVRDGRRFRLVDGFHRFAAAQNRDLPRITVQIIKPRSPELLLAIAFETNVLHGLALTLADKRAYAEQLLRADPQLSNMETSRRAHLACTTVTKLRNAMEASNAISKAPTRRGRDGKSYPAREPAGDSTAPVKDTISADARRDQRAVAKFVDGVTDVLEKQAALELWDQPVDEIADAVRAVKGDPAAHLAGEILLELSAKLVEVARVLAQPVKES